MQFVKREYWPVINKYLISVQIKTSSPATSQNVRRIVQTEPDCLCKRLIFFMNETLK